MHHLAAQVQCLRGLGHDRHVDGGVARLARRVDRGGGRRRRAAAAPAQAYPARQRLRETSARRGRRRRRRRHAAHARTPERPPRRLWRRRVGAVRQPDLRGWLHRTRLGGLPRHEFERRGQLLRHLPDLRRARNARRRVGRVVDADELRGDGAALVPPLERRAADVRLDALHARQLDGDQHDVRVLGGRVGDCERGRRRELHVGLRCARGVRRVATVISTVTRSC